MNQPLKLDDPDGFYAKLIEAHADLSEEESHLLNVRLVLFLANEVGSAERVLELMKLAKDSIER